jgi:NAD(P)-dependent dehydrogenase (short-subunit alcohol dehydrogenase family)
VKHAARYSWRRLNGEVFTSKVWLVTGSASGLGGNIAAAVLASGDHLVATARDPRRLEDLVKKYGWADAWPVPAALDAMLPSGRSVDSPRLSQRKWLLLA